jgi:hypothetical protein
VVGGRAIGNPIERHIQRRTCYSRRSNADARKCWFLLAAAHPAAEWRKIKPHRLSNLTCIL